MRELHILLDLYRGHPDPSSEAGMARETNRRHHLSFLIRRQQSIASQKGQGQVSILTLHCRIQDKNCIIDEVPVVASKSRTLIEDNRFDRFNHKKANDELVHYMRLASPLEGHYDQIIILGAVKLHASDSTLINSMGYGHEAIADDMHHVQTTLIRLSEQYLAPQGVLRLQMCSAGSSSMSSCTSKDSIAKQFAHVLQHNIISAPPGISFPLPEGLAIDLPLFVKLLDYGSGQPYFISPLKRAYQKLRNHIDDVNYLKLNASARDCVLDDFQWVILAAIIDGVYRMSGMEPSDTFERLQNEGPVEVAQDALTRMRAVVQKDTLLPGAAFIGDCTAEKFIDKILNETRIVPINLSKSATLKQIGAPTHTTRRVTLSQPATPSSVQVQEQEQQEPVNILQMFI